MYNWTEVLKWYILTFSLESCVNEEEILHSPAMPAADLNRDIVICITTCLQSAEYADI